jgi:hypothetical protein
MLSHNNDIIHELKELSPIIASFPKVNPFVVPEGYFDALTADILMRIEQPLDLQTKSKLGTVPEGYFDNLAENILQKIKDESLSAAEEIRQLSPALMATGNDNVFTVPRGYFEDLPSAIMEKLAPKVRVVEMKKRRSFLSYAVAAVFTGLIGLSLFNIMDSNINSVSNTGTQIAILNFDNELKSISEADIVNYLKDEGEDVEAALVASASDTRNLPDEMEYILDENTLDQFLNEINIDKTNN